MVSLPPSRKRCITLKRNKFSVRHAPTAIAFISPYIDAEPSSPPPPISSTYPSSLLSPFPPLPHTLNALCAIPRQHGLRRDEEEERALIAAAEEKLRQVTAERDLHREKAKSLERALAAVLKDCEIAASLPPAAADGGETDASAKASAATTCGEASAETAGVVVDAEAVEELGGGEPTTKGAALVPLVDEAGGDGDGEPHSEGDVMSESGSEEPEEDVGTDESDEEGDSEEDGDDRSSYRGHDDDRSLITFDRTGGGDAALMSFEDESGNCKNSSSSSDVNGDDSSSNGPALLVFGEDNKENQDFAVSNGNEAQGVATGISQTVASISIGDRNNNHQAASYTGDSTAAAITSTGEGVNVVGDALVGEGAGVTLAGEHEGGETYDEPTVAVAAQEVGEEEDSGDDEAAQAKLAAWLSGLKIRRTDAARYAGSLVADGFDSGEVRRGLCE